MSVNQHPQISSIEVIHTLGPSGTNCERAAVEWFRRREVAGRVVLYHTLEEAAREMPTDPTHALLGCVVYPDLHTLVFSNLSVMAMVDCFVFPTFNMVLASRDGQAPRIVASHPAPRGLVPTESEVRLVTSNVLAAKACGCGEVDGCVTTLPAARAHGLTVVRDYGPLNMGFTIHAFHAEVIERHKSHAATVRSGRRVAPSPAELMSEST